MSQQSSLSERLANDPSWMRHPAVSFLFSNTPRLILLIAVFLLYGYFLSHQINLVTADLGRHIVNGVILSQEPAVFHTNFYSYTNPNFEVLNHHFGSGVIFAGIWKLTGFVGVQLFFILLSLATLAFFILSGKKYAGWGTTGLIALLIVPLLGERTEIRPEVFTYFFSAVFFYLLSRYRDDATSRAYRFLWILPILQILWVNTHIYFLLGPLLIGAFLLESIFLFRQRFFPLLAVWGATVVATLINPFGIKAITATMTFFDNFGYKLAENQSVWFLENMGFRNPNYLLFKILFCLLVASFVARLIKHRGSFKLANFFVACGIGTLALIASRNMAIFGFFAIPIIAGNLSPFIQEHWKKRILMWGSVISCAVLFFALVFGIPKYFPYWQAFGWGLLPDNNQSIQFIQGTGITGPIFNNYDIGGYLIFYLFPREKVFVDNRPEAYPASFFSDEYIPIQESTERWEQALLKYNFNTIIFAYHDATPWGQTFLKARINDSKWAPVYVDNRVLIFVRRTEKNRPIFERYELPKSTFESR
ncbi:MAG: hypothetical protein COV91_02140 [Candidatus Taylorbacteria bacterium CG11_big_fil_rev_8_21_14_0_20_46_11]|uniref:Glycosyltransferase RgtA/B/C/D-like domain-containing protein n=1 Tax=Candidatus Taylorbacteria bacterium CG11_big_fil_rev_8_21_14_0_20_46_11 TaxID=1975025 RepID=A0A2H0KC74_9BACT|nr:MAG: hypothetical protein COV91_02140 [Candidatus Taylorbacteria bacterium CG11_big_fil_rev_8_21_14_0_20_46_11]